MRRALVIGVVLSSVAACGARQRGSASAHVEQTFPAAGVARVELRAAEATGAEITEATGPDIRISGTATGGAKSTQTGASVPAAEWGLDFVSKRYGDTLVISTKNEVSDAQHRYTLEGLVVAVPEGVRVDLVTRALTGSRAPDLGRSGD